MSVSSTFRRDVAWQASGNALAQSAGILAMPIISRLYSPKDFAVQALFIQLVTLASAIVTMRYEYFIPLPRARGDAYALNGLVLVFGISSIFLLTLPIWLYREKISLWMGNESLAEWLVYVPITAVTVSWAVAAQNNAQRVADFRLSGLSEFVGKTCNVFASISGAVAQLGVLGLVASTGAGSIGKIAFLLVRRRMSIGISCRLTRSRISKLLQKYWRIGGYTTIAHLVTTLAIMLPQIAISRLYGLTVLGQFSLVLSTIYLPSVLIGSALGQVYYQRAAALHARRQSFHLLWRSTALKLVMIGVPLYSAVSMVSSSAYPVIFGDQWILSGRLATWMSVAAFCSFVSGPMDRTCLIVGAGKYSVIWSLFRLVTIQAIISIAIFMKVNVLQFTKLVVFQMCLAYFIDFYMGHRFSRSKLNSES